MIKIGEIYKLITFDDNYVIVLKQNEDEVSYYMFKYKHCSIMNFNVFKSIYKPIV